MKTVFNLCKNRELVEHPYAIAEEHFNIRACRGLAKPLAELWPKVKHSN